MTLRIRPVAVVFDMDGLLFDTETLYLEAAMAAAAESGHEMTTALFHRLLGGTWRLNKPLLEDYFGSTFCAEGFRSAWMRHFDGMAGVRLALKPGVVALLDTLDELGLPRAIATSSYPHNVHHHLTAHGLSERFDAIVAYGDYVASKPAADPYLKAAERLGVDSSLCLALEDSFNGVRSASSAGMMTVMVPDLVAPTDEIRALCTLIADDLHVVRDLILAAPLR